MGPKAIKIEYIIIHFSISLGGCDINLNIKQATCFPSISKVELKSGKKIAMNELEIGDLVKTYSNDGEIVFSPVITFLDQDIDYKGYFRQYL